MMNFFKNSIQSGLLLMVMALMISPLFAQESNHGNKFEQLGNMLPDGNQYRGMDGAPGPKYWQQRADYEIECRLDVDKLQLQGQEMVTYYNQSPSSLSYLWVQLDENEHAADVESNYFDPSSINRFMSEGQLKQFEKRKALEKYGHKIQSVRDDNGNDLSYTINQTMMRIDLAQPIKPGETFTFHIDWYYNIINRVGGPDGGRGGYEYFEKDGNYLFTIAQWFPRMCVYSDFEGWQNKQFTGRGEFALTFGDYVVKMDVPADYVVGSTGECLNYKSLLSSTELARWEQAQNASEPVEIVTLDEAKKNEKRKRTKERKTWIYKAQNVRDFAWTASPKFVWDAMPHTTSEGKKVMCMSYYPKESYPIYNRYSTKAVEHTLDIYSKYSIPYPYPVAISVEAANGMEYPMICFNPGRAEEDGTYTESSKMRAISVIIHEVGHNYFPMIINSDERQWTWMDEGINSFVQYLAEQEFDNNYKSRRGPAYGATNYMRQHANRLEPIMTNSENIIQFGNNAYMKPAVGLNILRETIMGRELFDFAFKEYCERWAFKHPTPADFFRTMEDASGVDLDWFWRGWFYSIEPVDIALEKVEYYQVDMENDPKPQEQTFPQKNTKPFDDITKRRNRDEGIKFVVEQDSSVRDFYTDYKPWETEDSVTNITMRYFDETFTKEEKEELYADKHYYQLSFSNKGGLPMPIILEWEYEDGTKEIERIPVEIWRLNENEVNKAFMKTKKVAKVRLDPYRETADVDESNNAWPEVPKEASRFQIFKKHKMKDQPNPMQKAKKVIKP